MDRRSLRYEHASHQLPDGRLLVTRKGAAHLADRHVDHLRKLAEAQRRRWLAGDRTPDEAPVEVLCTVAPRMVLLDVDAVTAASAVLPFAARRRRAVGPE